MYADIYPISPIDAAIGGIIRFSWNGNQAFKNRCIIKDNETNEIVYDYTLETFKFEHQISLEFATLENGKKYDAFITVFDRDGNESEVQQLGTLFYCLSTPIFNFTNLVDGQIIASSSYEFTLDYSQEQNELLDSWSISLYSFPQAQLATSGTKYNTDRLSYLFVGFDNKKEYYVRGEGRTINGIVLDTGYIKVSVTYEVRDFFSLLEPTNLSKIGAIQIRSNIVSSEGHLEREASYINGEFVDLRHNSLTYTEGFILGDPFSLVVYFCGLKPNTEILLLKGTNIFLTVTYRIARFGSEELKACFELKASCYGLNYVLYSNKISIPDENTLIGLCLVRKGNLFNIEIKNLKEVAL